MSRFLLILSLVLSTASVFSQEKLSPQNKTKALQVSKNESPFLDKFTYQKNETSLKNFSGASAEEIINFIVKQKIIEKKEFEKNDEFIQRLSTFENSIKGKQYAFNLKFMNSAFGYGKYDADREVFKPLAISKIEFIADIANIDLSNKNTIIGKYSAINGFGAQFIVTQFNAEAFGIQVSKDDLIKADMFTQEGLNFKLDIEFDYPLAKAKNANSQNFQTLFIGELDVKDIYRKKYCTNPTFQAPLEGCQEGSYISLKLKDVIVFNALSGEIIFQRKISSN